VALLRGTLSRYELVWIYYNALRRENVKLRRLVEKYALLKNLRKDLLTCSKELLDLFNEKHLSIEDVQMNNFSGRDFEYYLTDRLDAPDMYYIGAFFNSSDISVGKVLLNSWHNYIG